jgi:hypothetical protein
VDHVHVAVAGHPAEAVQRAAAAQAELEFAAIAGSQGHALFDGFVVEPARYPHHRFTGGNLLLENARGTDAVAETGMVREDRATGGANGHRTRNHLSGFGVGDAAGDGGPRQGKGRQKEKP